MTDIVDGLGDVWDGLVLLTSRPEGLAVAAGVIVFAVVVFIVARRKPTP